MAAAQEPVVVKTSELRRIYGTDMGRSFGQSHLIADMDGDGFDDLVVGSGTPGEVSIFYAPFLEGGWSFALDEAQGQGMIAGSDSAQGSIYLGYDAGPLIALAVGDVIGADGVLDLVVGTAEEGLRGVVRVYSGPFVPDSAPLEAADAIHTITPYTDTDLQQGFGGTLAVGDLDDDGYDDLAIGQSSFHFSPGIGPGYNYGRVWLLRGETSTDLWMPSGQMPSFDQTPGVPGVAEMAIDLVFQGGGDTDYLGSPLKILDLVPGGPHELLIGNASTLFMFSNPLACTGSSIGNIFLIPPQPTEPPLPTVDPVGSELAACFAGSYPELRFAAFHSASGGDFEGLWIGLPEGSGEAVFVGSGVDWSDGDPLAQSDQTLVGSSVTDGLLGTDVTSGDLNRDGQGEIVVIAPDWDSGVADVFEENPGRMGAVYIISSCSAPQAFGASTNCLADTAGSFGVDDIAAVRIEGTVAGEWGPFAQVVQDRATVELEVINDRLLIFAPRFHHPSLGADVGVVLVYQLGEDADGDGFWTEGAGPFDCDDNEPSVYPGAAELCDGLDNDCDGALANGEFDVDGDGSPRCVAVLFGNRVGDVDCDDDEARTYPGNPEVCDGYDNDCDKALAEGEVDGDGDYWPLCTQGLLPERGEDCDDTKPRIFPGADEICDGRDGDCDGSVPVGETDGDTDGFVQCDDWVGSDAILGGGDCDDEDDRLNPGVPEFCDNIDQDCDGEIDEDFDIDGDGYTNPACSDDPVDCNDDDPAVYPGAPDGPEPEDQDCDGTSDWPGGCSCSASPATLKTSPLLGWWSLLLAAGLLRRRRA